jgi:hypothetical protein
MDTTRAVNDRQSKTALGAEVFRDLLIGCTVSLAPLALPRAVGVSLKGMLRRAVLIFQ